MSFEDLLHQKRAAIVDRWSTMIAETYPEETAKFMKEQSNRFSNPVGYSISQQTEALYGALLRASRILAIDTDPEALRWARRNLSLNGQPEVIELSSETLETLGESFDLTVANLILGTIVDLLPCFPSVMKQAGILILSGILSEQVARVEGLLPQHGLKTVEVLYEKEWACIRAKKGT